MAINWETPSGILTIIQENSEISDSVQVSLDQYYSDVSVKIISGELPNGISLTTIREGYLYGFSGTVDSVSETKTYYFTLRAYNDEEFADRYFGIQVTNKLPYFDEEQSVFEWSESTYISIQINMLDNDDGDKIVKVSGSLPTSLSLNDYGMIYGNAGSVDEDTSYNFVLGIERNGIIVATKEFTITILDTPEDSEPIWITDAGYLGSISYRDTSSLLVKAYDPTTNTTDNLLYEIIEGQLPDGLELEINTGRISGTCTTDTSAAYYFIVRVSNDNGFSDRQFYITANLENEAEDIVWVTESDLGEARIGDNFYLSIKAESGYNISYMLSNGFLPTGLSFNNGIISGEVEFQDYKSYTFLIEATNGYRIISREFTLTVVQGLGLNAVSCYLYINHEYDDEYTNWLATLDTSYAYESSNALYKINNKPKVEICRMKSFDKTLLKDMLYYNRPLYITWDKTYRKEYYEGDEVLYNVYYKPAIEGNTEVDLVETYTYNDGSSESISFPSIDGIREILSTKIYVEKLENDNVLYELGSQEIIDIDGTTYPEYKIYYDEENQTYYAESQEETRYLDVYTMDPYTNEYKQVFMYQERENYIGNDEDELYGGNAFTDSFQDIVYGGDAFTTEWEQIISSDYGRYIIKPVKVFEERLNTDVDLSQYYIYEKGTTNLQEGIIFTLSWKADCKFIILNGQIYHIGTISNPWVYRVELNETPIHDVDIVLPYVTDDDVTDGYIQFFDIDNETVDVWKTGDIETWQANTQYIIDDVFIYDGVYYKVTSNFVSTGVFSDASVTEMSDLEAQNYTATSYFPEMTLLYSQPNANLYNYQVLNQEEEKGMYFTGLKMDFYEVHFSPIYNDDLDNFAISFYNHIQERSPEFQLI